MDATSFLSRRVIWAVLGLPIGAIAGYLSWLIVLEVVRNVVPAVLRAFGGA